MSEERFIEQAEAHISRVTEDRIANLRAEVPPPGYVGPEFCDCGEDIPHGRRVLGYSKCLYCASKTTKR